MTTGSEAPIPHLDSATPRRYRARGPVARGTDDWGHAGDQEGVVWLHGYGNLFEKVLEPGETIDVDPGGWVYRDHSVQMNQEIMGFKTGFLAAGAGQLIFNRFTGPGRICLQSMYYHSPQGGGRGAASEGGSSVVGGLIRGLTDS